MGQDNVEEFAKDLCAVFYVVPWVDLQEQDMECIIRASKRLIRLGYMKSPNNGKCNCYPNFKAGMAVAVKDIKTMECAKCGYIVNFGNIEEPTPTVQREDSSQDLCECGHKRLCHIYESGSCRTGKGTCYCVEFKPCKPTPTVKVKDKSISQLVDENFWSLVMENKLTVKDVCEMPAFRDSNEDMVGFNAIIKTIGNLPVTLPVQNAETQRLPVEGHNETTNSGTEKVVEKELEIAKDHIMYLLPMAKGYAYPTNIKPNLEKIQRAEEFIKEKE